MSANWMVRPCSYPVSAKLARGRQKTSTPCLAARAQKTRRPPRRSTERGVGSAAGHTVSNPIVNKTVMLQTYAPPVLAFCQCILGAVNFAPHKCPTFLHALKEDDDCYWQILLQKSFWGVERKFLEPLVRFARGDVRDHIG